MYTYINLIQITFQHKFSFKIISITIIEIYKSVQVIRY